MATRLYLPDSGSPSVSPAYSTSWNDSTQMDRIAAVTTKGTTALATKTITESTNAAQTYVGIRQYVSPALTAEYTITNGVDTMDVVVRSIESDAAANASFFLIVRGWNGSTFQGIYSARPSVTEFATSLTSRGSTISAFTTRTLAAGDRFVIEFGTRMDTADTTARTAGMNFGDSPATALTVGNTDTDADYPYFEFSGTVPFPAATTVTNELCFVI